MIFTSLKLKEAEIEFQQEKIENLEKGMSGKFEAKLQEASGLTTESKPFGEMTEETSVGKNNIISIRWAVKRNVNDQTVLFGRKDLIVLPKGFEGSLIFQLHLSLLLARRAETFNLVSRSINVLLLLS